jgi:hypothetical protein
MHRSLLRTPVLTVVIESILDYSIWGLVAPVRFFAGKYTVRRLYFALLSLRMLKPYLTSKWLYLGFPIGAALPFITYRLHKKYPGKFFDRVMWPIVLDGSQTVPQAYVSQVIARISTRFIYQVSCLPGLRISSSLHFVSLGLLTSG